MLPKVVVLEVGGTWRVGRCRLLVGMVKTHARRAGRRVDRDGAGITWTSSTAGQDSGYPPTWTRAGRYPRGSPSTRVARMLRWISDVPAKMLAAR
jgi:hypothetical protein